LIRKSGTSFSNFLRIIRRELATASKFRYNKCEKHS